MAGIEHERLTSALPKADDRAFDRAIRPKVLEEFIGHEVVVEATQPSIAVAEEEDFPGDVGGVVAPCMPHAPVEEHGRARRDLHL